MSRTDTLRRLARFLTYPFEAVYFAIHDAWFWSDVPYASRESGTMAQAMERRRKENYK